MTLSASRRPLKRAEVIAKDLTNYIIDSGLPPGAVLPQEQEMSAELGVGRNTLREALRLMESMGVVEVKAGPKGGPTVRHPQPADLMDALTLILQFQRGTLREVHQARSWLEPAAAGMAATLITPSEIELLRKANTALRECIETDDMVRFGRENSLFHGGIAGACANIVIRTFAETLLTVSGAGLQDIAHPKSHNLAVVEEHDAIVEALARRDAAGAADAMRRHLEDATTRRTADNPNLMDRAVRWVR